MPNRREAAGTGLPMRLTAVGGTKGERRKRSIIQIGEDCSKKS